jgi:hypothetical protein
MSESYSKAGTPRHLAVLAAVSSFVFAGLAFGQVPDPRPQEEVGGLVGEPIAEDVDDADVGEAIRLDAGVTYTTAYYFRGALQLDNSGFVFQPYANIGVDLANAEDYDVNAYVGTWNSFHTKSPSPPTNTAGPDAWYESDLYGGVNFTTGDFTFGGLYTFYTSPANAFNTIQEVGLVAGWAPDISVGDSDTLDVTLGLNGGVYFETKDQNGTEDSYFELGVTPGLEFDVEIGGEDRTPVQLTFPAVVGFSIDEYFFDEAGDEEFFGFVSVGVQGTVPLPVPRAYGDWTLTAGLQALFLEAENLVLINEGDSSALVGSVSVGFEM